MTTFVPRTDTLITPVLLGVRNCLREALVATPAGPVMRAYLWHGQTPPTMEGCACTGEDPVSGRGTNGDAWVRRVSVQPDFGREGNTVITRPGGAAGACLLGWFVIAEMGTYRCIPIPKEGEPLPEDHITATSIMLDADEDVLREVLSCCGELHHRDALEVMTVPVRRANCGGKIMTFRFHVTNNRGCPEPRMSS